MLHNYYLVKDTKKNQTNDFYKVLLENKFVSETPSFATHTENTHVEFFNETYWMISLTRDAVTNNITRIKVFFRDTMPTEKNKTALDKRLLLNDIVRQN